MKNNAKLGIVLAILGILAGIFTIYLMADQYNLVIEAKRAAGRFDEATSVTITYAVLGWFGIAAGAIWATVLYGFCTKAKWAWFWGVVASTIQLLVGFFPAVPAMDSHLSSPTLIVFVIAAVLWLGMLLIRGVKGKIILLAFVAGLAYVLTFMDGVAPISKYTTSHGDPFWNGMYVMTQEVSWWGAAAWAIFIFGLLKKKTWTIAVGIFAGVMSMFAGYPLGIHNALYEVHRFSLFLPAPLISTGLVIFLILPGSRKMIESWIAS
ncbi:MAG: hypothetical protein ABFD24_03445 [Anaerolineaceae bacterium]